MEVVIYVIGALLFFLCIEIFILILEVVKLSSALQSYFITHNKNHDQVHIEKKSLISLLSKFVNRGIGVPVESYPDGQSTGNTGDESSSQSASHTTAGGESTHDKESHEERDKHEEDGESQEPKQKTEESESGQTEPPSEEDSSSTPTPPESSSAQRTSQQTREKPKRDIPETKPAANITVRKCPYCGKENSSFRKKCFFCSNPLPDE